MPSIRETAADQDVHMARPPMPSGIGFVRNLQYSNAGRTFWCKIIPDMAEVPLLDQGGVGMKPYPTAAITKSGFTRKVENVQFVLPRTE